jgi:hypothetical protein
VTISAMIIPPTRTLPMMISTSAVSSSACAGVGFTVHTANSSATITTTLTNVRFTRVMRQASPSRNPGGAPGQRRTYFDHCRLSSPTLEGAAIRWKGRWLHSWRKDAAYISCMNGASTC